MVRYKNSFVNMYHKLYYITVVSDIVKDYALICTSLQIHKIVPGLSLIWLDWAAFS